MPKDLPFGIALVIDPDAVREKLQKGDRYSPDDFTILAHIEKKLHSTAKRIIKKESGPNAIVFIIQETASIHNATIFIKASIGKKIASISEYATGKPYNHSANQSL